MLISTLRDKTYRILEALNLEEQELLSSISLSRRKQGEWLQLVLETMLKVLLIAVINSK